MSDRLLPWTIALPASLVDSPRRCAHPSSLWPCSPGAPANTPPPLPAKPVGWSQAYCTDLWPWVGADDHIAVIGSIQGKCDVGGFHVDAKQGAGFLAWFDADGAVTGARTFAASERTNATIAAAPGGDWWKWCFLLIHPRHPISEALRSRATPQARIVAKLPRAQTLIAHNRSQNAGR